MRLPPDLLAILLILLSNASSNSAAPMDRKDLTVALVGGYTGVKMAAYTLFHSGMKKTGESTRSKVDENLAFDRGTYGTTISYHRGAFGTKLGPSPAGRYDKITLGELKALPTDNSLRMGLVRALLIAKSESGETYIIHKYLIYLTERT